MALGLTEEHLQLAETVRGWAQRNCPPEAVRAAADGPDSGSARYLESLAPGLAEQGLLGLHVPDEDGGQGYGLPELTVALEELGRGLVPGAFLPTVFASAALVAAGVTGKLVTGLADGSRTGAVGLASGLTASRDATGTTAVAAEAAAAGGATAAGGALVVEGESSPVLGASLADVVILPVQTDSGEIWAALDASSLEITALDSLDLTRPVARVRANRAIVPADRLLTGLDRPAVTSLAAILFGAEASGIADWATRAAAEYAKIRHQFGRPIGQFQAVKHRCAWMLTAAEQAAAAVWDAARTGPDAPGSDAAGSDAAGSDAAGSDARDPHAVSPAEAAGRQREFAAGVAAVVALDAAVWCAHQCIQVLGGIGYTWEHEAHLYYRRAMSLRALLGPSAEWERHVAGLALAGVSRPVQVELPGGAGGPGAVEQRAQIREELSAISRLAGPERAARLAADGWVVPHLPRPWGRGAGAFEQVVIHQEMKEAGLRAPGLAIGAWVVPALIQYGTAEQQQRFLPPTLRGDFLWCQLFSEPGAGSDLAGLTTRAVRVKGNGEVGGGWKLTGQKIWTSLAMQAAWAICIARTDPAAPKHDGITYFLVDMSSPGVEVRPLREITGDSMFNQVFLDEVFVPDDCVVGEVNGGWRVARTTLANERVSLSQSWAFGSGVPELLQVAKAAPDSPLGPVGTLVCEGHAIDLLALRVTLKQLSGTEPGATGSVRKLLGMRHAQQVADLCFAMSGTGGALGGGAGAVVSPSGSPNGSHWARQVLLGQALTIGGGTTDIQLNIIGERILGLPRDPEPLAG